MTKGPIYTTDAWQSKPPGGDQDKDRHSISQLKTTDLLRPFGVKLRHA